jgi:hypothetical protein
MRKTRINRRTIRKQTKRNRRQNRKQRGGKIVLPMRYFSENFDRHYSENPSIAEGQVATSHGIPMRNGTMTGPDLHIAGPVKQQGGGVLPAEYFGGNSGQYFEEGSPELLNCETAYGRVIPRSHGVVMDAPNGNWMGPNLASFPNSTTLQTGGSRRRRRTNKRTSKRGGGSGKCCGCGPKKGSKKKGKKGGGRRRTRGRK